MSQTSLAMVNQKLAYSRATMALLDGLSDATNASQRLQHQALLDAGAFHLLCAYSHYLRELGENYALPNVLRIMTEDDLQQALAKQGKEPAEIRELQQLRHHSDSWLAELNASYQACWTLSEPVSTALEGRIAVMNLDAPAVARPVTRERLRHWYSELTELIARQRETSSEY